MDANQMRSILREFTSEINENVDRKLDLHQKNITSIFNDKFNEVLKPLQEKVEELDSKVTAVEKRIEESDDISARLCNLQMSPVPFRKRENLASLFNALSSKLGYSNPPEVRLRRFKGSDDNNRPICITFATEFHKIEFLSRYRVVSSEIKLQIFPGFSNDSSRVYLQHDFTPKQYQLYKLAGKLLKEKTVIKVAVQKGNRILVQIAEIDKPSYFPDAESLTAELERRKNPTSSAK